MVHSISGQLGRLPTNSRSSEPLIKREQLLDNSYGLYLIRHKPEALIEVSNSVEAGSCGMKPILVSTCVIHLQILNGTQM